MDSRVDIGKDIGNDDGDGDGREAASPAGTLSDSRELSLQHRDLWLLAQEQDAQPAVPGLGDAETALNSAR